MNRKILKFDFHAEKDMHSKEADKFVLESLRPLNNERKGGTSNRTRLIGSYIIVCLFTLSLRRFQKRSIVDHRAVLVEHAQATTAG